MHPSTMGTPRSLLQFLLLCATSSPVRAATNASALVDAACAPWTANPKIACINRYASLMPYHFFRNASYNIHAFDSFTLNTSVASDASFAAAAAADFLIFNRALAADVLGPAPALDFVFSISDGFHDGPVFVPDVNKLYASEVGPGLTEQRVVDLSGDVPTLGVNTADPPLYVATGAQYYNGLVYYCANGGNVTEEGEFRPGVYTFNATSNESKAVLNNYFGYYFNTCDDLVVDAKGDVWFTDPSYSWADGTSDTAPQLQTSTYRFRPSTGEVRLIDDTLRQPNGIGISPDQRTLYVTDTGAGDAPIDARLPHQALSYNATGPRTVYAFDVSRDGTWVGNKRPVYRALEFAPDGFKVARNGYLVTATGRGVDVLTPDGALVLRVQTNFTAVNVQWAGVALRDLWIVGRGGIARVSWNLTGPELL